MYLLKGEGSHTIDTVEYAIKTPVLFTVRKEQVHFWDITQEPEGFVLIIKKTFIDNCWDKDIKSLIAELSSQNCLFPKDDSLVSFFTLFMEEYEENNLSKKQLIDGLLKALIAKILESKALNVRSKNNSIFQKFMETLNAENKLLNKVSYYAEILNTSPQNLNAICRKETDQSASEVLSNHIISEAKRLLLYTDFTVSEISFKLGFKDNSHFSKYFKRFTKNTPINFRNENS